MDVQVCEANNIIQKGGGMPGTLTFRKVLSPSREFLYAYSGDKDFVFVDNLAGHALISLMARIMHETQREGNFAQFIEMGHLMCGLEYHLQSNKIRWNFMQLPNHPSFFKLFLNGLLQFIRGHDIDLASLSLLLPRLPFVHNYRITNRRLSAHLLTVVPDSNQARAISITFLQSRDGVQWERLPSSPPTPTTADDDSSYHPTTCSDDPTLMDVQHLSHSSASDDDV
jgi:hypothetical protein